MANNSAVIGLLRVLLSANSAEFTAEMRKSADTAKAWSRDMRQVGQQATQIGSTLTAAFTVPIAGIGIAASKLAIDFESAFAGVRKTVSGTPAELNAISDQFRAMAKTIPVTAVELAKIGETAGQLGVQKDKIAAFARTIADISVATHLTADEAGEGFAKLANVMKLPQSQFSNLGSAVVALGNFGASTEQEMLSMAQRIAAAGASAGMTVPQVLGIANALSSVGIEAEAGGTAISRVIAKMAGDVDKGGGHLKDFARVAGMSSQDFQRAFKDDAGLAFSAFMQGLSKLKDGGESLFATMDDLGFKEIRLRNAMLSAANSGSLMADSIKLGTKAFAENTELTRAAQERYKTTANELQLLRNRISDVGITLGNAMRPAIEAAIQGLTKLIPIIDSVAKFFGGLPASVQLGVVAFAAVVAAAGPVIYVFGQIVLAASTIVGAFTKKGIATRLLVGDLDALGKTTTATKAGVEGLTTGVGMTTTALTLLTKAAFVAQAAFVGWEIGKLIVELTGLDTAVDRSVQSFEKLAGARARSMGISADAGVLASQVSDLQQRVESLRKQGFGDSAEVAQFNMRIQSLGSQLDVVNRAISHGAAASISYADAIKFNVEWEEKRIAALNEGAAAGTKAAQVHRKTADELKAEAAAQKEAAKAAKEHAKELAALTGKLDGDGLIKKADLYVEALHGVTSLSTLTADKQREVAKTMNDAIAAYHAAGTTVPSDIARIANEANAWVHAQDLATEATRHQTAALAMQEAAWNANQKAVENYLKHLPIGAGLPSTDLSGRNQVFDLNQPLGFFGSAGVPQIDTSKLPGGGKGNLAGKLGSTVRSALATSMIGGVQEALTKIPQLLTQAFTGGGGIAGAMKALGVQLSDAIISPVLKNLQKLGKTGQIAAISIGAGLAGAIGGAAGGSNVAQIGSIAASLTGAAASAGLFGSAMAGSTVAIGAATLGIGAAAVGAAMLIKHFTDSSGRKAIVKWVDENFGSFDTLHQRMSILGDDADRLWKKLTQQTAKGDKAGAAAVMDEIAAKLTAAEQKQTAFNSAIGGMLSQIQQMGSGLPESLRSYLSALEQGGKLTQENLDLVHQLAGQGAVDWHAIEAAVNRYGGEISQLGGSFQEARLHDSWQQVIDDMALFADGGISAGDALSLTKGKVQELVLQSLAFSTTIPENMRSWIQKLIDTGDLLDASGAKITDIDKLTFGETLQTTIDKLTDAIQLLIDQFNKIPGAIAAIPRNVDIDVKVRATGDGTDVGVPQHGTGGFFDTPHLAVVGDKPEYITPASSIGKLATALASHLSVAFDAPPDLPLPNDRGTRSFDGPQPKPIPIGGNIPFDAGGVLPKIGTILPKVGTLADAIRKALAASARAGTGTSSGSSSSGSTGSGGCGCSSPCTASAGVCPKVPETPPSPTVPETPPSAIPMRMPGPVVNTGFSLDTRALTMSMDLQAWERQAPPEAGDGKAGTAQFIADGRLLAEIIVPHIPGAVKRLGLSR